MKKFYVTLVAMACGLVAIAQNDLTVSEITVKPGAKGEIEIGMTNTSAVQAISFKISTVTGIKLTTKAADFTIVEDRLDVDAAKTAAKASAKKDFANGDIDEDEYNDMLDEIDGYSYTDLFQVSKEGTFNFKPVVAATAYKDDAGVVHYTTFKGNDGALLKCPVTVADDVAEGAYDISLTNIVIASPDASGLAQNVADNKEITFKVTVGDGTGINSIKADDVNAPVYNLAGQRVSKAQQGVFIQNGKKIAVK